MHSLKQIMDSNVRVFFYLEDRERRLDSATDKVMLSLTNFAAEFEQEKAVQRTREAMRRKAKRDHVAGGFCYGYENRRVGDHVEREIVPAAAEVVRRIFEEIAAGDGFCRIAKRLNDERIPGPTRRRWGTSGVRELVMRELYRGRLIYGKTRWERRRGRRKVDTPAAEWITVEVPVLRMPHPLKEWSLRETRGGSDAASLARLFRRPPGW